MEDTPEQTKTHRLQAAARLVGEMLAEAGDFYDVVENICIGYANVTYSPDSLSERSHLGWQLIAANELRSVADNWTAQLVTEAREEHWTWAAIGDALEVTRQAAQQRYGSYFSD